MHVMITLATGKEAVILRHFKRKRFYILFVSAPFERARKREKTLENSVEIVVQVQYRGTDNSF